MAADHSQTVADLGARVRELTLFHDVTRILLRDDLALPAWLEEIARVIAGSWPQAGVIAVRARLGSIEAATSGVDSLAPQYRSAFRLADGPSGSLEIGVAAGGGPPEETQMRALLDDITDMFKTAADRRLMMTALRQSEQRYRSVVEHQSDLVCRYLPDTTLTFVNDAYCRFFGKRREELIGTRFIDLIPDADRPAALAHIEELVRGGEARLDEHSVVLPDGGLGRQQWLDHAIAVPDGGVVELQGIGRDITDRWRAEEALRQKETSLREAYDRIRSLAHRLIVAQEKERTEIARELHDDISQQLAALGIGLSLLETQVAEGGAVHYDVVRLRQMAIGLAEKIRHVSHALHPGVLKHAGLHAAIAAHCDSMAGQHAFRISFESRGSFNDLPGDVALCLYRATQQALRNVAMHANATRAWVTLVRADNQVELNISDNGRGFDTSAARSRGLGLLSIEERVHLNDGRFSVSSRLGGGSRVAIVLPIGDAAKTPTRPA